MEFGLLISSQGKRHVTSRLYLYYIQLAKGGNLCTEFGYILLHSDLPLRDVLRFNAKVKQDRNHEEIIKYMHYSTFSNGTNDLTSAQTRTLSFLNTFQTTCSRTGRNRSCKKWRCRNEMDCGRFYVLRYYIVIIHLYFSSEASSCLTFTAFRMLTLFGW